MHLNSRLHSLIHVHTTTARMSTTSVCSAHVPCLSQCAISLSPSAHNPSAYNTTGRCVRQDFSFTCTLPSTLQHLHSYDTNLHTHAHLKPCIPTSTHAHFHSRIHICAPERTSPTHSNAHTSFHTPHCQTSVHTQCTPPFMHSHFTCTHPRARIQTSVHATTRIHTGLFQRPRMCTPPDTPPSTPSLPHEHNANLIRTMQPSIHTM